MPRPPRRALLCLPLLLAGLAGVGDELVLAARGSSAPAWSHWWCSASASGASVHRGQPTAGLLTALLNPIAALLPHWPHILPIVLALATLVYLRRANAHYHSQGPAPVGGSASSPAA